MKFFSLIYCLNVILGSLAYAESPKSVSQEEGCTCKECRCTYESHCGCLSKEKQAEKPNDNDRSHENYLGK